MQGTTTAVSRAVRCLSSTGLSALCDSFNLKEPCGDSWGTRSCGWPQHLLCGPEMPGPWGVFQGFQKVPQGPGSWH